MDQPAWSVRRPPMTSPALKPRGWPPPIAPKAKFLLRPDSKYVIIKLTADGKQKEMAMPASARNTIIWAAVFDRPHANVNTLCKNVPSRYILRGPTRSATAPDRINVQPHVKEYIEAGLTEEASAQQRRLYVPIYQPEH